MNIFISATTGQFKACRDAIACDLRATGADVRVQEDFTQGPGTLLKKLETYIAGCERVVLLIGDHYGAEPTAEEAPAGSPRRSYTQLEYFFAIGERLDGSHAGSKDLYVYFASDDYLAQHTTGQSAEEAELQRQFRDSVYHTGKDWQKFSSVHQLQALVLRDLITAPAARKPNNLPYASLGELFKGRDEALTSLHDQVLSNRRGVAVGAASAITQPAGRAISGLGGIGKTRLAVEFAHRYEEEFSALLFVRADSTEGLQTNLAALCGTSILDLPEKNATETEVQAEAALRWLEMHTGWLLIFDNVDTVEAERALQSKLARLASKGSILITSRLARFSAGIKQLELDLLTPEASVEYLIAAAGRRRPSPTESTDSVQLSEALGFLPLALSVAAAYINAKRLTFLGYLDEWNSRHGDVLKWYDENHADYPMSVAVTWDTSFSQLTEPAKKLLQMLAWFAPDPIPESLLDVPASGEESTASETAAQQRDALVNLEAYCLVTRASDSPVFSVHRLVQDVTRSSLGVEDKQSSLNAALNWINKAFIGDPKDVRTWPTLAPLAPHVRTCATFADESGISEPTSRLLNQLGLLYLNRAEYSEAEPLMRRALAIDEASYGNEHPTVARGLNNLAQLLQETNRLVEAEPLMRRALAIDEASYGAEHPSVARDLNNLAILLQNTNRLTEAEPLMRRALAIDEASYGPEHPEVATDLNNLAQLLKATNRFTEAEPMLRRSLDIAEASYGANHPKVATRLHNLALLLQNTNRLTEAEPLMRRALAIDETSYGPEHPEVATDLNNLALLLHNTNRLAEAEPLMRRAHSIFLASYGPDHPRTISAARSLAGMQDDTGK